MADRRQLGWIAALAASLALHAAALWFAQRAPRVAVAPQPSVFHVHMRPRATAAPPPRADRAPVAVPVAPTRRAPPDKTVTPETAPPPTPEPPPAVSPAPPAEPTPEPATALWIDATFTDQSPAPAGNDWHLAEMPWPTAFQTVEVRVWINTEGRIERFELQGAAAEDPDMQRLFAPFAETPMKPAHIGSVPVPSTMLIQIWPGDGPAPDFISPLPPATR